MFALIITLRIDPTKLAEFETAFTTFAAYVHENEPGTLAYHLGPSEAEAGAYRLIEIYESDEAFAVHKASAEFMAFKERLTPLRAGAAEIEKVTLLA